MHSPNISAGISVKYRTEIIDAATGFVESIKESKNLWLDSGFERMGLDMRLRELLKYVVFGTGTKPTRRDSGTITASQAGNTVTASAAFFEAEDVGRLLKFDSGAEVYVTGYTSATAITVADSATRGGEFTIWYVNETAHEAGFLRVSLGETVSEVLVGDTYTLTRRATTTAFATARLIREIGWSDQSGTGVLIGRDLIPGGGDYVAADKQYRVTVSFSVKYGQAEILTQPDIGNNGFSTAGTYALECISLMTWAPWAEITLSTDATPLAPMAMNDSVVGIIGRTTTDRVAYVPGSRRLEWVGTFDINTGNSTNIRSVCFGWSNAADHRRAIRLLLDAPQTKDSLHTLKIGFAVTLSRFLVN